MAKIFYLLSLYGGEVTNEIMRSYRLETSLSSPLIPGTRTYIGDGDGHEIDLEISRHFHIMSHVPEWPGNFQPPTEVKGADLGPDEIYMTLQTRSDDRFVESDDLYNPYDMDHFASICKWLEAAGWELVNW